MIIITKPFYLFQSRVVFCKCDVRKPIFQFQKILSTTKVEKTLNIFLNGRTKFKISQNLFILSMNNVSTGESNRNILNWLVHLSQNQHRHIFCFYFTKAVQYQYDIFKLFLP